MKMCDILFITPNVLGGFVNESLGTLQLATILKNNHVPCKIMPFRNFGDVHSEFDSFVSSALSYIDAQQPKIISMYTRCDTYHISLKLAQEIKAKFPNIYMVLGGPQSDTTSLQVLACIPQIDFVCCGEGETTIYPFFSSLLAGEPDLSIPGLVYRKNGTIIKNPRPELIADLDSIPKIDFVDTYFSENPEDISNIFFPIDVGRGCPFGCSYCSTQAFWGRKYRLKSPSRIFEEVKAVHDTFGVTKFIFSHDMFTFNKKTVIETCNLIRTLDFPIQWACSARLDCLDRELIDIMVDAGLYSLFAGIETGSVRMQKIVHKNLKLDNILDLLIYLREKNVLVDTSFIYGFPQESKEDLSQTLALMAKIMHNQCGIINTHLCTFLPCTELSQQYQSELTYADYYSNFTGNVAIDKCEDLIRKHPQLFPQLMEYKTDLRSSLQYFPHFIRVWRRLVPIYQYISKSYSNDSLIDMYYDFVAANRDALEKYGQLPLKQATHHLIREDRLHLMLENDENFDLITDCRMMYLHKNSQAVKNGESLTAIYCFDPKELDRIVPLEEFNRSFTVVNYIDNKIITQSIPIDS